MSSFHEIIRVPEGSLAWIYLFSENGITEVTRHWHHSVELTLIVKGEAIYSINGQQRPAREGDIMLINSGDAHSCSIPPDSCEAVTIMFPNSFLSQFASGGDTVLFHLDPAQAEYPNLLKLCKKLYHVFAMRKADRYAQLRLNAIVCDIAYLLLSDCRWTEFTPQSVESKKYRQRCRELMEFVDTHYSEDITMDSLVETFYISREHLARIFREHMGTTYKKYLTRVRMYHAYRLLTGSDLTIIEIALACGFSDSRAFIASFRQVYGTTPGKYRRAYQNTTDDFANTAKLALLYDENDPARHKNDRIVTYSGS